MKLESNSEGVVIGSGTLEEYKFQAINFMNGLYSCIVEDRDYSFTGYSNLRPWTHNLLLYLERLESAMPHEYYDLDQLKALVYAIRLNLEALTKNDSESFVRIVKGVCVRHWEDLLKRITRLYHLEYKTVYS